MVDFAAFSDILSQLGSFSRPAAPVEQEAESGAPQPSGPPALADVLDITRIPSNHRGSSFDSVRQVAAADGGAYRPNTAQTTGRFAAAFSFEFNLSIQREATVVQQSGGESAIFKALETTSLSYQSEGSAYRGELGSSFGDVQRFQTELFYSRTRELTARFDSGLAQQVDSTSRRVARTFELNISLEVSFLNQFIQQSDEISGLDTGLFEQYLSNTDGLAGVSGEALQSFFDDVDRILQKTEAFLQETLGDFFQGVVETFGLSEEEAAVLQPLILEEVTAFFDDMGQFLEEARTALAAPGEDGQLPAPESPVAEEDTELALV